MGDSSYEPELIKAEIAGIMVTLAHHLRRIEIAKDRDTALFVVDKLTTMASKARNTARKTK